MRSCRFCGGPLEHSFCDLGISPFSNSFLSKDDLDRVECFYPLHARLCAACWLVQLDAFEQPEHIFSDYAYFSSYSDSWLEHAQRYVAEMTPRFGIGTGHQVVELASNDGYLLQYFKARGIPVLGIEPAANVARVAVQNGIPTRVEFFSTKLAEQLRSEGCRADVLIANNVLAHVPDLNDFVQGIQRLLSRDGVATVEVPHLLRLIRGNQFDTIYHEHFSYFSLMTAEKVFAAHGLKVFDVDELPTHGGSLRLYACHREAAAKPRGDTLQKVRADERDAGLTSVDTYARFNEQARATKRKLLELLLAAKNAGKQIVGYGAAAKGNTLLNYCGVRSDFIDYVADRSPHKQGHYLPGTHISIESPARIAQTRPDYLLVLAWNLKDEVMMQNSCIREWGGRFLIPIPHPVIL